MKEFKPIKEGKVREVYDNGDSLIIAATDRISAFDVILSERQRCYFNTDVQVLVQSYREYRTKPYDFNRCERYAGIFPERKVCRTQHDVQEA